MGLVDGRGCEGSSLRIRLRPTGTAVVVHLDGRLTVDADLPQLGALAEWAASRDRRFVTLNLSNVRSLDCAGLGELAAFCAGVIRARGRCALVDVERRQLMLLERAGLVAIVPVFRDEEEALTWFREAAAPPLGSYHDPRLRGRLRPCQASGDTHAAESE